MLKPFSGLAHFPPSPLSTKCQRWRLSRDLSLNKQSEQMASLAKYVAKASSQNIANLIINYEARNFEICLVFCVNDSASCWDLLINQADVLKNRSNLVYDSFPVNLLPYSSHTLRHSHRWTRSGMEVDVQVVMVAEASRARRKKRKLWCRIDC